MNSNRLIIAEKPDMGKKIASALAKPHKFHQGYIETGEGVVTWAIGHILQTMEPHEYNAEWKEWKLESLPMLIEELKLKVDIKKSSQFKIIKDLLKKTDIVINAGDPGREGQLIIDEILYYLNFKKPTQRVLLYSLDKASITKAFQNLEDNQKFFHLYEAGVCRSFADFSMGLNATRAFTLKAQKNGYKGVLSVGRVQSPTLAIVVKREEEILNFKPHDYYIIKAEFSHNSQKFSAYWKPSENTPKSSLDEDNRLIDNNLAQSIVSKIINKNAQVVNFEESQGQENAPLPFNLSKLQIYANSKWGLSAKEVLDICQRLYEHHELQTYPRTDCQYLPENQFIDAPSILQHIQKSHPHLSKAVIGADTSLKSPAWNDAKLGEHFGLIPTKKEANLSELTENEKKIYQLVCERYISQFYPPCIYKTAKVSISCESELFQANGKIILEPGWRSIFSSDEDVEESQTKDEEEQIFPNLSQGQTVLCTESKKQDKKTTPPPRFTEGTLIKAMTNVHTLVSDPEQKKKLKEKKGIGQEATRADIIEKLFKRVLMYKQGKQIYPSAAGNALISALPKSVIDPALTAIWEDALDKIAEGKMPAKSFCDKQNLWIQKLVEDAKKTEIQTISGMPQVNKNGQVKAPAKNTTSNKTGKSKKTHSCPKCNTGELVEKTSKNGNKFLACNSYPKCNHMEWPKK